jgi:hypothetical protein
MVAMFRGILYLAILTKDHDYAKTTLFFTIKRTRQRLGEEATGRKAKGRICEFDISEINLFQN